jgi:hypothetical protein
MASTINASTSSGLINTADTSGILQLQTANTAALTIDASQNVGIGTSSPTEALTITNDATYKLSLKRTADSSYAALGATGNAFLFYNNGAERMRIDSSGNLGLGVTPSAWSSSFKAYQVGNQSLWSASAGNGYLSNNAFFNTSNSYIYRNNGFATEYIQSTVNGSHSWHVAPSGTAGNAITFTQAMTLDASGRLGIGQTSLTYALEILSSSPQIRQTRQLVIDAPRTLGALIGSGYSTGTTIVESAQIAFVSDTSWTSTSAPTYMSFSTTASGSITATERARIDSSGNLLVGTTSVITSGKAVISFGGTFSNGLILSESANISSATFIGFNNGSTTIGSVARVGATSAVAYNTTSDQRLKSNIQDSASVINKLMQVKVRQYDWTDGDLHQDYGFIAQELEPILSGVVTKGKTDDDMWQLDYSKLTPHLLKAIQEQQAIIESLKARLDAANL